METAIVQTEWERLVPPGAPLVIHGAGNLCHQLLDYFPRYKLPTHGVDSYIVAITDNDAAKHGYHSPDKVGVGVFDPEFAIKYTPANAVWVILVHLGAEDVRQQLIGLGVSSDRIVHWWTLWQHFDTLKVPAWADVPPHPEDWLDVWSDEASRQVVRDAYDFFKTYSDRTAVYRPREAYSLPENIYFDEAVYRRVPDERFLDCGAFDGDTLKAFSEWVKKDRKCSALAVEASPENFRLLEIHWDRVPAVRLVNAVLVGGPNITQVEFGGKGVSACIGRGVMVPATTIDKLCDRYDFRPTLIKLDIEGAELDALRGGVETIQRDRPVIACCLYHHPRDLWEIPAFLASACEDYIFYARCYEDMGWETVAYAVPRERSLA